MLHQTLVHAWHSESPVTEFNVPSTGGGEPNGDLEPSGYFYRLKQEIVVTRKQLFISSYRSRIFDESLLVVNDTSL